MITAGVDVGARFTKIAIVEDSKIIGLGKVVTGFDIMETIEKAFSEALAKSNLNINDIERIVATGMGRENCKKPPYKADKFISEIVSAAVGSAKLNPGTKTVIDVGAEDCRVSRIDDNGGVLDFATNDKCAAGTGTFIEVLARIIETDVYDFGRLSLSSKKQLPINAQCTVFAESEVISLIHHFNASKEDIAGSIMDALTSRVSGIVRRVGLEEDIVLVGGPALIPGFTEYLQKHLNVNIVTLKNPEYVCAYGASLI